jgi:hypothetical protein
MDMKYEITELAETIAEDKYGVSYEELPFDIQMEIFDTAGLLWAENRSCEMERIAEGER